MYEGQVCVGCMSTEGLLELFPEQACGAEYWRLLASCFDIQVCEAEGHGYICAVCAGRLRDADNFKRQVVATLTLLTSEDNKTFTKRGAVAKLRKKIDSDDDWSKKDSMKENKSRLLNVLKKIIKAKEVKAKNELRKESQKKPSKLASEKQRISKQGTVLPQPIKINKKPILPTYKVGALERACRECAEEFPNSHSLKQHMNQHYPNYRCRDCGKVFMLRTRWQVHQRTHKHGKFKCDKCDKVFENVNTLISHKRHVHSHLPSYACAQCGQRYRTYHQRLAHIRADHGIVEDAYKCPHCDKTFPAAGLRSKHIKRTHEYEVVTCPLCPFRSKPVYVKFHLINIHNRGEKACECPGCGKRYSNRSTFTQHLRTHIDDRPFRCVVCGLTYVQLSSLRTHLKLHLKRNEITPEQFNKDIKPSLPLKSMEEMMELLNYDKNVDEATYDDKVDMVDDNKTNDDEIYYESETLVENKVINEDSTTNYQLETLNYSIETVNDTVNTVYYNVEPLSDDVETLDDYENTYNHVETMSDDIEIETLKDDVRGVKHEEGIVNDDMEGEYLDYEEVEELYEDLDDKNYESVGYLMSDHEIESVK